MRISNNNAETFPNLREILKPYGKLNNPQTNKQNPPPKKKKNRCKDT